MDGRQLSAFVTGVGVGAGVLWCWIAGSQRQHPPPQSREDDVDAEHYDASIDMAPLGGAPAAAAAAAAAAHGGASVRDFELDEILSEQLARNVQFFGLEGQKKIANSFVVVVGLGGVGSHAAHLLLRSGVGRLRLVDFDQVSLSSLNRHCLATRRDVGTPKAACLASHFADILPEAHVEALNRMYDDASEGEVLAGRPDFVIDAIDNIGTKVSLLAACKRRGLPVLCVAGAGAKADPTRLRFVDVAESAADPLARAVRRRLRQEHGIEAGVTILMSTEKPRCGLVYGGEEGADMLDYQVVPNFRVRTIPVLGTTPAVFGLAAAAHVLCQLAGAPFEPAPVFRLQARSIQTQYDRLEARERERWGRGAGAGAGGGGGGGGGEEGWPGLAADVAEVEVALRELWRGTSARAAHPPSNDRALSRQLGGLALTRWDPARPAAVDNLVLFTREEADAHDAEVEAPGGLEALRIREPALRDRVEAVLARARREFAHSYFVDQ